MMYDPNVFTLNLEQLMSGTPIDAAIGVLQVTIISGTGLKTTKLAGGNPDPYVNISINNDKILASTSWKENTGNPQWVETKFVLVQSLTGSLGLSVADYNEHRKDSSLGKATWDLSQLVEDATREGQTAKVYLGGKERGELKFDVYESSRYYLFELILTSFIAHSILLSNRRLSMENRNLFQNPVSFCVYLEGMN